MNTAEIRCKRCGRVLTAAASIAAGRGRTCAAKAAVEASFKPAQVAKAIELVELGAIRRARRGSQVFRTVSSDGARIYLTTRAACTCPAGVRHLACYHRAGVLLATA